MLSASRTLFRHLTSSRRTTLPTMGARHLRTTGERSRAIVLLSGGLDSATVLAMALSEGYRVTTLSFDYGQRHQHELMAAAELSERLGVSDHRLASVDSSIFYGATSLTLNNAGLLSVPKKRHNISSSSSSSSSSNSSNTPNFNDIINNNNTEIPTILPSSIATTTTSAMTSSSTKPPATAAVDQQQQQDEIPIPSTYVPARNTIFLSYALALAESVDATDIFIGANAVDYSGYPDCRPDYFRAFQRVADLGTKKGVTHNQYAPIVRVPLLHWSKREIIETGLRLGVDYAYTHSCYDPGENGRPCTLCDSCLLRADAFAQLGFAVDPVVERFQRMDEEKKKTRSSSGGDSSGSALSGQQESNTTPTSNTKR